MPDLQQLLIEESSRLSPVDAPPFDELVRRHRRRSRRRSVAAVALCGVAVASAVVLVPQLAGTSSTERLAQPTTEPSPAGVEPPPAAEETPVPKQPPPGVAATFRLADADRGPLPGNEWELAADPSVSVTVEVDRTGSPDVCMLFFQVLPEDGGTSVGDLQTPPPEGGGTGDESFLLTWTAVDPEQRPLPPGRYRLVAGTQEQDPDTCGDVGYRGSRRDVQTSLGLFVVPSP